MTITDRQGNVPEHLAYKAPVRVATTANITLSGLQTIDGIALNANDRVLVWQQADPTQNGIYQAETGPWTRPNDANLTESWIAGTQVFVNFGSTYGSTIFKVTAIADPIIVGTTALTFSYSSSVGAAVITKAQFLRALHDLAPNGATVMALASAISASRDDYVNIAYSAEPFAPQAGVLATFVQLHFGLSGAQMTALFARAASEPDQALAVLAAGAGNLISAAMQPVAASPTLPGALALLGGLPSSSISSAMLPVTEAATIAAAQSLLGITTGGKLAMYTATDAAYGVKGDGVTNDTTAINSFLTACSNNGVGAYFPGGLTYELGGGSITVPDGVRVLAGRTATFRRSADPAGGYTAPSSAMISLGNYCTWTGGIFANTIVLCQSTTSNAVTSAPASVTFTVPAGLTIGGSSILGSYIRVYSRGTPSAGFEGVITTYSGTTMTLTTSLFGFGSGTYTDWNMNIAHTYGGPCTMYNVTESVLESARITGNWYVGPTMNGYNADNTSGIQISKCTYRGLYCEGVQNRGIQLYGTVTDGLIADCFIDGLLGVTNYACNLNCANGAHLSNSMNRVKMLGCTAVQCGFQGFEIGDQCSYCTIEDCTVAVLTATAGIGFLVQLANGGVPQYNDIVGCEASNCGNYGYAFIGVLYCGAGDSRAVACGTGFLVAPSGSTQSQYVSIANSDADGCTANGFEVEGNSNHASLFNITAVGNGGVGVQIDTGANTTRVSGFSASNGTNLVDNGTSSGISNLGIG